ncbi:2-C-methyl-D-erythritol 2,4-cyclodiphosphate synthase [Trichinella pseudospiralis]
MIGLQANRIWRSKLDVAYWRSHLVAYHVLRIMRRFGQIDVVNVLVGVVFNAFPNPSRCHSLAYCAFAYHEVWLRKQSTGYEVSLHQTTVVVQVGILTSVTVKMKAAS